jgi:hypothetical protein
VVYTWPACLTSTILIKLTKTINYLTATTTTELSNEATINQSFNQMPYLVTTPTNPRSFLTNNPVIYMDARSWGWRVESLPYYDNYCKTVRDEEMEMGESFRRDVELERVWEEEGQRRKQAEDVKTSDVEGTDDEVAAASLPHTKTKTEMALDDLDGEVARPCSGGSIIHGWD